MAAAREASDKLEKGADFAQLGKGLGMKENDVNLGTFTKAQLADQKLADAAFALKEGEVSKPIDSFAPVIVKVTGIRPGAQIAFEDVKDKVRDALARSRASEELSKLYDAVEDARGGGAKVGEAAKKLNLNYNEYAFDRRGLDMSGKAAPAIAANPTVLKLAFDSDVGVENNAVTLGEGHAFVDVLEVIPERQKTFEEVSEKAKLDWIETETRKRVHAKADELVKKAKGGAPIEKIAEEAGATVSTSQPLKREDNPKELPRTAISLAFTLPKEGLGSVQMPDRLSQAVIQVEEIKPAPPLDDKQAEALREELRRSMRVDLLTQYVGGLQKDYGVQVNNKAISAVIGE
jgi:peptidyl-prolyl cis-trans isomerase D